MTRHQQDSRNSPVRPSPRVSPPGWNGPPSAFPRASHPADQEPDDARRGGDRPPSTDLEQHLRHQPNLQSGASTRGVRPRVARRQGDRRLAARGGGGDQCASACLPRNESRYQFRHRCPHAITRASLRVSGIVHSARMRRACFHPTLPASHLHQPKAQTTTLLIELPSAARPEQEQVGVTALQAHTVGRNAAPWGTMAKAGVWRASRRFWLALFVSMRVMISVPKGARFFAGQQVHRRLSHDLVRDVVHPDPLDVRS